METNEIIENYHQLRSCEKVAKLFGCSSETIRRILKNEGVPLTGWKRTEEYALPKKKYTYKNNYEPVKYDRVCAYCGKEFEAHNKKRVYCSVLCKDIAYRIAHGVNVNCSLKAEQKICVICGKVYETRDSRSVTCGSQKCIKERTLQRNRGRKDKRYERTWEEYVEAIKNKACAYNEKKKAEKEQYKHNHTVTRECAICGALFLCLDTESKKTCSTECSCTLKRKNRARKDKRIPKKQRVDNINLTKLYERDNGVCYLCGGKCDWSDWRVSKGGNEYPGDKYPTVEHVIPVSMGGLDSWENVRLAHWKCNIDKGANVAIGIEPAQRISVKSNSKKTAQYLLDGTLVKIWESTAQIRRELGLNDGHIQNVCRGDKKTAYGYYWEYVV